MIFVPCTVNPYDVTIHAQGKKKSKNAESENINAHSKRHHGLKTLLKDDIESGLERKLIKTINFVPGHRLNYKIK